MYGCGSIQAELVCFHVGNSHALLLWHISLERAKQRFVLHFFIYQFYSTRLIQRKSKFTLVDIMWPLHSNRIGKKLFGGADSPVLVYTSMWPWNHPKQLALLHCSLHYTNLFPQYLSHIPPALMHFVTNPAFVILLSIILLCTKEKYGIYLHSLVLLMDLTPLHMTLLWRPHRETEQIIPLINVSHECEQIIKKSRYCFDLCSAITSTLQEWELCKALSGRIYSKHRYLQIVSWNLCIWIFRLKGLFWSLLSLSRRGKSKKKLLVTTCLTSSLQGFLTAEPSRH